MFLRFLGVDVRYIFVISTGAGMGWLDSLASLVAGYFPDRPTTLLFDPSDALIDSLCRAYCSEALRLVAVGGDGTVNRLLTPAARYGIPIGILPRGTANDLARAIGLKRSPKYDLGIIRGDQMRSIDLISVNGRYYVTCGGLGLPSSVVIRRNCGFSGFGAARIRSACLRKSVYLISAFLELSRRHAVEVSLDNGRQIWNGRSMAAIFSNQARFGAFFSLSPEAVNDDGAFDYCLIPEPANRLRGAGIVLRAAMGKGAVLPGTIKGRLRYARIRTDGDVPFFGDGEILTHGREFSIELRPRAVRLIVPEETANEEIETCAPAAS